MTRIDPSQVSAILREAPPGGAVHLIGAGGCGMSGLGHLLLDLGFGVSGSDLCENEDIEILRRRGARIGVGHAVSHLGDPPPFLVVYSSAIRLENPEILAAQQLQIPIARRASLLAALVRRQRGICVAGMHGKTTTTSLLAFALEKLQAEPSFAIGATVPQLPRHARFSRGTSREPLLVGGGAGAAPNAFAVAGQDRWFVVEADESDGTLREFHPEHAIVLNVDEEHLDYYETFEAICDEFQRFASHTSGRLVYCADDPTLVALFASRPGAISYGFNPAAQFRLEAVTVQPAAGRQLAETLFEIHRGTTRLGGFSLNLVGEKNVSNAAAVVALLTELGYEAADIARALRGFTGAARRQELLHSSREHRIYDDYGHHPREIAATLRALKQLGCGRLLVAFQPHRFTRTRSLLAQFATCFSDADCLWLTEVYAASEPEIPGINGGVLADAVRARGQSARFVPVLDDLVAAVRAEMRPGDLVLFLGAGDITRVAHQLAAEMKAAVATTTAAVATAAPSAPLAAELRALLAPGTVLRENEPLAKRTTLRVGGPADFFIEPASDDELARLARFCAERAVPFFVLGRGSNLLVRDGGIRGVVVSLAQPHFSQVEIRGERLHCGAGAKLKTVAVEAKRHGLSGLEFLEGIPGSVGGALRMNAGAMGSWTFAALESLRFMDFTGQIHERPVAEVPVKYRSCPLLRTHIALGAVFRGRPAPRDEIEKTMRASNDKRWTTQPAAPSAGCIFKNPGPCPAGKLIDELGLKGRRVGDAVVSDVHGNFIVNGGHATARDVLELIEQIRAHVRTQRGLELETEVEIIGEP
ncbi:hypothetical protein LBMAG56_09480 [Verrucomicrobiota bacterium]|nr:hypothetical protein LBMAG56_09480 [Verrucomicrobiota bacterium]